MNKRTKEQALFNYLNRPPKLSFIINFIIKAAATNFVLLLLIILYFKPNFPIILLLIGVSVTIMSIIMKSNTKAWLYGLAYALAYATLLHYAFKIAGAYGWIGGLIVFILAASFKLWRIKKKLYKILEERVNNG